MDELELRTLAQKLARKRLRRIDEDVEQELWIAGWRVKDFPEGYVVRTMLNKLIDCLRSPSDPKRAITPRFIQSVVSLDAVEVPLDQRSGLGETPFYPSEIEWIWRQASTPRELLMVLDLLNWNMGTRTRHGFKPISAGKGEWPPFREKLIKAWKEINEI